MPHIISTLSSDVKYTLWRSNPGGVNNELTHVVIHGGHGVAHRRSHGGLETPNGVVTSITKEQLELLEKDSTFQTHKQNGFITVADTFRAPEPEEVAKDMAKKDEAAPLDDDDFKEGGRAAAPKSLKLSTGKGK